MTDNQQLSKLAARNNRDITDGLWSGTPAVPATTVVATNTSGKTVWVEVTGGTVTAVKVDGVTIGTRVAGLFLVRPDSTIAWVGSAAPTWQWFLLNS
jgi:hypothetical protein